MDCGLDIHMPHTVHYLLVEEWTSLIACACVI